MRQLGAVLSILVITAFAGCGPKPKPVAPDAPDDPLGNSGGGGTVATVGVAPTPESICARIFELKATDCDLTSGYDLSLDECRDDFARSFDQRGPEARNANIALGKCLLDNDSCAAAGQCVASLNTDSEPAAEYRACEDTETYAAVGLSPADFAKRNGTGVTRFSQVRTTKETPVEVCGIPAQMEWLLEHTCDDASKPFRSYDHAHAARAGNVGKAGRCGAIVDLYEVSCPEATYKIFIDAYVCPLP